MTSALSFFAFSSGVSLFVKPKGSHRVSGDGCTLALVRVRVGVGVGVGGLGGWGVGVRPRGTGALAGALAGDAWHAR